MKLHIFADESGGQSSTEPVFVVAVVACDDVALEQLRSAVLHLEQLTQRGLNKWKQTPDPKRLAYLAGLAELSTICGPFYWRPHPDRIHGDLKTAETVAAAVRERDPEDVTRRIITIDALSNTSRDRVAAVFKHHNLQRRDVRGANDEASPFLRLADSLAGYLRHVDLKKPYAVRVWPGLAPLFHKV